MQYLKFKSAVSQAEYDGSKESKKEAVIELMRCTSEDIPVIEKSVVKLGAVLGLIII